MISYLVCHIISYVLIHTPFALSGSQRNGAFRRPMLGGTNRHYAKSTVSYFRFIRVYNKYSCTIIRSAVSDRGAALTNRTKTPFIALEETHFRIIRTCCSYDHASVSGIREEGREIVCVCVIERLFVCACVCCVCCPFMLWYIL